MTKWNEMKNDLLVSLSNYMWVYVRKVFVELLPTELPLNNPNFPAVGKSEPAQGAFVAVA